MNEKRSDLTATGRANSLLQWRADNFGFLTQTEADRILQIAKAMKNRARSDR
jgi:hypothetical protein